KVAERTPPAGPVAALATPAGRYVRVDTALRGGGRVSPRFDSLIAKVIGWSETFTGASAVTARALEDLRIAPVRTNRTRLHAILTDEEVLRGDTDTGYLGAALPRLVHHPLADDDATAAHTDATAVDVPDGAQTVEAKLAGVIASVRAHEGDTVAAGEVVLVVESMKMEHPVTVPTGLTLDRVLVAPGDSVDAGQVLAFGRPADATGQATTDAEAGVTEAADEDWEAEVEEIRSRNALAHAQRGPDKVARQHDTARLTARERIDALADDGSFEEIGPLAGFGEYDADGTLIRVRPSNYLSGTAKIRG